jgi:hypothetical protein
MLPSLAAALFKPKARLDLQASGMQQCSNVRHWRDQLCGSC